ncbi:LysE family transporter, partial [Burkholderia pseudomallei]
MTVAPTSKLSDGFFLSLSLCLHIGLVNVAMLSLTLSHGFWPGYWLGVGSGGGDLVYAALALAGLAVLLRFEAVRWVVWLGGGAVVLFLAWALARVALCPEPARN